MGIKPRAKAIPFILMPGHTIQSVIKQINLYEPSKEELKELMDLFKSINGDAVLKPGTRIMVPVLPRLNSKILSTHQS